MLSINNRQVASASSAAATIRSSLGDVDVVVERADPHEAQHRRVPRVMPYHSTRIRGGEGTRACAVQSRARARSRSP